MIKKYLAASVVLTAFAAPTQAGSTWAIEVHGVVTWGGQSMYLPDAWGQISPISTMVDLTGSEYTQTIYASTDTSKWETSYAPDAYYDPRGMSMYGTGPGFSTSVTINGHTYSYSVASSLNGNQFNYASIWGGIAGSSNIGYTDTGDFLSSSVSIFAPHGNFEPGFDQAANVSFEMPKPGTYAAAFSASSSFSGGGANGPTFTGSIDHIAIAMVPAPVPEPETYGVLLAGLSLISAIVRRRQGRA